MFNNPWPEGDDDEKDVFEVQLTCAKAERPARSTAWSRLRPPLPATALGPRQIQMSARRGFATHVARLTKGEDGDIGTLCCGNGCVAPGLRSAGDPSSLLVGKDLDVRVGRGATLARSLSEYWVEVWANVAGMIASVSAARRFIVAPSYHPNAALLLD